ncbi:uncharacterized protein LOC129594803 isoform X2 [Paramacrobiotus metropolitanus]|uniref:uncharacterized protein LOC129594803 isoform X2 n=1 Tax=Paramacrobiotus metropolitanus TaxID=2943436 RepID=UPI002445D8DB|nr:uncharacterized protein LOC129594803 isoform X2 [Paramacrobiotus metropolitanus]
MRQRLIHRTNPTPILCLAALQVVFGILMIISDIVALAGFYGVGSALFSGYYVGLGEGVLLIVAGAFGIVAGRRLHLPAQFNFLKPNHRKFLIAILITIFTISALGTAAGLAMTIYYSLLVNASGIGSASHDLYPFYVDITVINLTLQVLVFVGSVSQAIVVGLSIRRFPSAKFDTRPLTDTIDNPPVPLRKLQTGHQQPPVPVDADIDNYPPVPLVTTKDRSDQQLPVLREDADLRQLPVPKLL